MAEPMPAGTDFLRCDGPGCDHFEMTPVNIDAVDKPCPKCGANLCTKEDYLQFKAIIAANKAASELILREEPDAPLVLIATNVHGGVVRRAVNPTLGVDPFRKEPGDEA